MKVRSIALDDEELPASFTVEMTAEEAALIYAFFGFTPDKFFMEHGVSYETFSGITGIGSLFNRFYDEGWDAVGNRKLGNAVTKAIRSLDDAPAGS